MNTFPRFPVALVAIALVFACQIVSTYASGPVMHQFEQKLDHFNASETRTWSQRYTVTSDWHKPGGPIFLFLSGEAPMEFFAFQTVQIRNWAQSFGALYVNIEHRFYGESLPIPNYQTSSLKFLSSQQALADAANFITSYNNTDQYQWVVFGCSYSAGLAAWFRLKYPHLAVASVCPSGPVQATLNYTSFFGQFSKSAAPSCVAAAGQASVKIQQMSETAAGRAQLSTIFNACAPLQETDVYYFLWTLMQSVGSSDQMNNPPTWILNTTCNLLTNNSDILAGFAKAFVFNNGQAAAAADTFTPRISMSVRPMVRRESGCNDFSEQNFVTALQDTSSQQRSWWWQKCTEFGYFKPGYNGSSVFFTNLPVEHIVAYCSRIFGIQGMTPHIVYTNNYYGAKKLNASSVMFTNGLLDPWHLLSITENEGSVLTANYEAGHCGTLIAATPDDPPSLLKARQMVVQFLKSILQ